ncbi:hypothetical protein N9J88_03325 [Porticoccaceae bacterium]|nr:hypothetical protein [Porticoccaceae bacterium]
MKRINIFKSGSHVTAAGAALEFAESDLQSSVDAYDPKIHEAPITVGHPKDNLPAYGWISGLQFSEDRGMDATPSQVDTDFAEMVAGGKFKKISASFYAPDSPTNPVPGIYYLRHVAFLGAQPPAVKGLKGIEFNEAEEGIVEFLEPWDTRSTAGIFRALRDFIIDKFSKEEADEIIPDWRITELEDSARRQIEEGGAEPAFNENDEVDDMTKEQLAAEKKALEEREAKLKTDEANFSEREDKLKADADVARKAGITAKVDTLVTSGKVLPAEKEKMVDFACSLDAEATIEFKEGDTDKTQPASSFFFEFLESLKSRVDTGEHSQDENGGKPEATPDDIGKRAVEFREEQQAKGIEVGATQAVEAVIGEFADQ